MESYAGEGYNYDIAFKQFTTLYNYIAKESIVYLLPSEGNYQDQVYVANLGVYLPHKDVIVLSNYKSEPRKGEDKIGLDFFRKMGYSVYQPNTTIEGEADLKYIRDNIYIGGYGIRTDKQTYNWLEEKFDAKVIPVEMYDDKLYHFDCMCLPLSPYKIMLCTQIVKPQELKEIEKFVEVIDIPLEDAYNCYTNCLVLNGHILFSCLDDKAAIKYENMVGRLGYEAVRFDLSEFERSGAGLSCCVFHFNFIGRDTK